MSSIKLTNLTLLLTVPNKPTPKQLTITLPNGLSESLKQRIIKTKYPSSITQTQTIVWDQYLLLPHIQEGTYCFQIRDIYRSNPEEKGMVGQIVLKEDQEKGSWQVTEEGKEVGFLFGDVESVKRINRSTSKQIEDKSFFFNPTELKQQCLTFTSLYSNIPSLLNHPKARCYIQFKYGQSSVRSPLKRLTQGEYRCFQVIQLQKEDTQNHNLEVSLHLVDPFEVNTTVVGQAFTRLCVDGEGTIWERLKLEKVYLYNVKNEEVGWVSFKFILNNINETLDPRMFLQDKYTTIGDQNFKPLKNPTSTISPKKNLLKSPLQNNYSICLGKSKRFDNFEKKRLHDRIGLGHSSLAKDDNKEKYRIATFGFGSRVNKVQRDLSVPGVGRYRLPALFDRY